MRYDRDHKAQTRETVLKEAAAAIRLGGPDRVSVAAVMSRAGLTHGGFYAHFASKDELLAEAVDQMFADVQQTYFAADDTADPRTTLGRYVDAYLSSVHRERRDGGCPVPILAGEFHRLPDRARERFSAGVARMKARIESLLASAGVEDARERSESAVAEMVGAISVSRLTDTPAAETLLAAARRSVRRKLELGVGDK